MTRFLPLPLLAALVLAGCGPEDGGTGSARKPNTTDTHFERLVVLGSPPVIAAKPGADLTGARIIAQRSAAEELATRSDAQRVTVDALPYLTSSAEGRAFLALAAPRALARGAPDDHCPGAAAAGGADRGAAAAAALTQCLARVADYPDCGCQVVALDHLVTVPRAAVAYATGTTARLRGPGLDSLLVAEDEVGGTTLLRDLNGPVARLTRGAADDVTLEFLRPHQALPERLTGKSIKVGFRRGRLAERIYVSAGDTRLSLLIGFAPDELAAQAGAWLAWPRAGG